MKVEISKGTVFNGYRAGGLVISGSGRGPHSLLTQTKKYGGNSFQNELHKILSTGGVSMGDVVAVTPEKIPYGAVLVAYFEKGNEEQLKEVFIKIFKLSINLGITNLVLPLIGTNDGVTPERWADVFHASLQELSEVEQLFLDNLKIVIDPLQDVDMNVLINLMHTNIGEFVED
jgi:hypothetical protein